MMLSEILRVELLLGVIGYAAVCDWRTKHVPNKVWLYAIPGAAFTFLTTSMSLPLLISIGFAFSVAIFLYINHAWGGADTKAFMTLGISLPLFPSWAILSNVIFPFNMLPFITIFTTSGIVIATQLLAKSDIPLAKRKVKWIPYMFIGLIITVLL